MAIVTMVSSCSYYIQHLLLLLHCHSYYVLWTKLPPTRLLVMLNSLSCCCNSSYEMSLQNFSSIHQQVALPPFVTMMMFIAYWFACCYPFKHCCVWCMWHGMAGNVLWFKVFQFASHNDICFFHFVGSGDTHILLLNWCQP